MSHFRITYVDGEPIEVNQVSSLTYISSRNGTVEIQTGLEKYPVPVGKPFWLKTATGIVGISGDGIRSIEVTSD